MTQLFQLWETFFQCAITFIGQKPLELHKFSTAKRNKIINRYVYMPKVMVALMSLSIVT